MTSAYLITKLKVVEAKIAACRWRVCNSTNDPFPVRQLQLV